MPAEILNHDDMERLGAREAEETHLKTYTNP
jgi:hypothetical protein